MTLLAFALRVGIDRRRTPREGGALQEQQARTRARGEALSAAPAGAPLRTVDRGVATLVAAQDPSR